MERIARSCAGDGGYLEDSEPALCAEDAGIGHELHRHIRKLERDHARPRGCRRLLVEIVARVRLPDHVAPGPPEPSILDQLAFRRAPPSAAAEPAPGSGGGTGEN